MAGGAGAGAAAGHEHVQVAVAVAGGEGGPCEGLGAHGAQQVDDVLQRKGGGRWCGEV